MTTRWASVARLAGALMPLVVFAACPVGHRDDPGWANVDADGWVLVAPPNVYRDGGIRMDDRAPLWSWRRLGVFEDRVACRHFRDAQIVSAPTDEEWALWSLARCVTIERAAGGSFAPGECATADAC